MVLNLRLFVSMVLCCVFWMGYAQKNTGSVYGKITLPTQKNSIKKGTGYNTDGTPIMHADHEDARIENNVIVIAIPLSFQATLSQSEIATITQQKQTFIPYALPIMKGSTVYFLNEDQFFHNVYSLTPGARFNIGRRPPGSPYPLKIKESGVIQLSCDIHAHMKGYIVSIESPYFVKAAADLTYQLEGLPAGTYAIKVFYINAILDLGKIALKNQERQAFNIDLTE